MTDQILPIVLRYEETGVTEATEKSLSNAGFTVWEYADREGVGSMARAFNRVMMELDQYEVDEKYIWFVTNVTFPPELPASLFEVLESNSEAAAVHPGMTSSHAFINNAKNVGPIHFIEWTAAMVRYKAWMDVGVLDEAMPYVHFDLDWSHRAKLNGWQLLVDGRVRVDHTYLHVKQPEKISRFRSDLRAYRHEASAQAMIDKWGNDWKTTLCKGGNCG